MTVIHDTGWHPVTITHHHDPTGQWLGAVQTNCDQYPCCAHPGCCTIAQALAERGPATVLGEWPHPPGHYEIRHTVTRNPQGEHAETFALRHAAPTAETSEP